MGSMLEGRLDIVSLAGIWKGYENRKAFSGRKRTV